MSGPQTIADVLEAAADLIEPEGAWIREAYSNGGDGVGADSDEIARATCFCVEGAVARVLNASGPHGEAWCDEHLNPLLGLAGPGAVAQWNDDNAKDQAEVVTALREAAALARKPGA